ncbi:GmrSD restriction endonuclease domain-containing protein [Oerskovia sp. USHLN155]|uniref:GmrSD restriction endonuclease domain-containing protein n=1 Tax=Oerskovia sp. USHLN155 TaxID=3081288 RepID=UPI00301A4F6C
MGRTAPGWYPDPSAAGTERWFDGDRWSQHTRPTVLPTSTQRLPLGVGTLGGDAPRPTSPSGEHTSGMPFAEVRPAVDEQPASFAPASTVRSLPPIPPPPGPVAQPAPPAGPTTSRASARRDSLTRQGTSARRPASRQGLLSGPALWAGCAVLAVALAGSGVALAQKGGSDRPPAPVTSKATNAPPPVEEPAEDRTPDYLEVANSAVLEVQALDVDAVVAAAPSQSALATVALLEVGDRDVSAAFSVEAFGARFADTDGNGCDTRNDALARSLSGASFKPGTDDCVVLTGLLADPYSGTEIAFERGPLSSEKVQVDHVVALTDAWHKGARAWDAARREAFANDPLNVLVVDGALNQQKGDGDASAWLPPNEAFRCAYVARQVGVKYTYGLRVTSTEKAALVAVLSTCPGEPLPTGSTLPPPRDPVVPPVEKPRPRPTQTPAPEAPPAAEPPPAPAPSTPTPTPTPTPSRTPVPENCKVKGLYVREIDGATNVYYVRGEEWNFRDVTADVCFESRKDAEAAGFKRAWW